MNKINFILMAIFIVLIQYTLHSIYITRDTLPNQRTVKVISQARVPRAISKLTWQREQEERQQERQIHRRQRYQDPPWDANPFYAPTQGIRSDAAHAQDPNKFEQYTDPLG